MLDFFLRAWAKIETLTDEKSYEIVSAIEGYGHTLGNPKRLIATILLHQPRQRHVIRDPVMRN